MLASLLAAGATATSASAATCTKYAAPTGADTGAGTLESPFRSVQKLSDSLVSGQVGCLRGGSYTSSSTTYFRSAATTVMSYPGERAKVNGYGEVSRGADGVTLKNIDFVSQGTAHTIRIYGNRTIVEGNDITDSHMSGAGACIGVGGSEDHPDGVIIRLNKIHDCGSNSDTLNHGIYAASFRNLMIRDNIFWMNGGYKARQRAAHPRQRATTAVVTSVSFYVDRRLLGDRHDRAVLGHGPRGTSRGRCAAPTSSPRARSAPRG